MSKQPLRINDGERCDGATIFFSLYIHFTTKFLCTNVLIIWPFVTFIDAENVDELIHCSVFFFTCNYCCRLSIFIFRFHSWYCWNVHTVFVVYFFVVQGWDTTEFPVNTQSSVLIRFVLLFFFFFGWVRFYAEFTCMFHSRNFYWLIFFGLIVIEIVFALRVILRMFAFRMSSKKIFM